MKALFLLAIISLNASILAQNFDEKEYAEITKTILANEEIRQNLLTYAYPLVYGLDTNLIFILDTIHVGESFTIHDQGLQIWVSNISRVQTSYSNYWLSPTSITKNRGRVTYQFRTESQYKVDTTTYIKGEVNLKIINGNWKVKKVQIDPYEYWDVRILECYMKRIDCMNVSSFPKKSSRKNKLFGDWQMLQDNYYHEMSFSDDSVYAHREMFSFVFFPMNYETEGNKLIFHYFDSCRVEFNYKTLNKNSVEINWTNSIGEIDHWDGFPKSFTLYRIKDKGFRLSQVACWHGYNRAFNCYLKSNDRYAFEKAFHKRMMKYKCWDEMSPSEKKWLRNL